LNNLAIKKPEPQQIGYYLNTSSKKIQKRLHIYSNKETNIPIPYQQKNLSRGTFGVTAYAEFAADHLLPSFLAQHPPSAYQQAP